MRNQIVKLSCLLLTIGLVGCSMKMPYQTSTVVVNKQTASAEKVSSTETLASSNTPIAGSVQQYMDENDRSKAYKALDSAPGKSTQWVNANTGASYTVVPTKKVAIQGNPYCREYDMTVEIHNSIKHANGTACVGSDGSWHEMS